MRTASGPGDGQRWGSVQHVNTTTGAVRLPVHLPHPPKPRRPAFLQAATLEKRYQPDTNDHECSSRTPGAHGTPSVRAQARVRLSLAGHRSDRRPARPDAGDAVCHRLGFNACTDAASGFHLAVGIDLGTVVSQVHQRSQFSPLATQTLPQARLPTRSWVRTRSCGPHT